MFIFNNLQREPLMQEQVGSLAKLLFFNRMTNLDGIGIGGPFLLQNRLHRLSRGRSPASETLGYSIRYAFSVA